MMKILAFSLIIISYSFGHFGAKWEPPDGRVIHGLGQYVSYFYTDQENWQYVSEYQTAISQVPVIYSVYAFIDPIIDSSYDHTEIDDIVNGHDFPYILTVGLGLMDDSYLSTGTINIQVENILNGSLDYRIIDIAQRIKSVNAPVYLRPGFEFGENNSGIHNDPDMGSTDFIDVWMRIHNIFQQENVTNVAWVWNTVNPSQFGYMDWYPGDNYVDWWGINYFTLGQINSGDDFLNDAAFHNKPVMICESSPIQNGGTTNASNWDNWFIPYFNKIKSTAHLKAFIYISDPWNKPGFFDDWPDSRIDQNETIRQNYAQETEDLTYIHMPEYQANPGDVGLPVSLISFDVFTRQADNLVQWRTESEINNLGFNLYRAENPTDQTVSESDFVRINQQFIPGAGSISLPQDYSYIDDQVQNDHFYWYQLEDIDYNNNGQRHEIVKVHRAEYVFDQFELFQNYPNPFNNSTSIQILIPRNTNGKIHIVDIRGSIVKVLHEGKFERDYTVFFWDGRNEKGSQVSSGLYFCTFITKGFGKAIKILYIQ